MRRAVPSALNLLPPQNSRQRSLSLFHKRRFSSLVVNIPQSNIYRFGDGQRAVPALRDVHWSVKEGESWAITGGQRNDIVEVSIDELFMKVIRSIDLTSEDAIGPYSHYSAAPRWTIPVHG
jgi:hypothetical protein